VLDALGVHPGAATKIFDQRRDKVGLFVAGRGVALVGDGKPAKT